MPLGLSGYLDKYASSILLVLLGEADRKTNLVGLTEGGGDKTRHSPGSKRASGLFFTYTTFNEMVVNEAWELRYFSPLNQHQVKPKSRFYNWERSDFFFKAYIHLAFCNNILGRIVDVRKNIGRSLWGPWAESDLQDPGGPGVVGWEMTWEGIELGVSGGWLGIGTGNREVWKLQVKMNMSGCRP